MSEDQKKENGKPISRRGLLGTAALAVGVASSVVAARSALARSADVTLDAAGRVVVDGAVVQSPLGPDGTRIAAKSKSGHNENCTNTGCAKAPTTSSKSKGKS